MLFDIHGHKRDELQHCESCRFYFTTPKGDHGNCHRFPPNGSYGSGNITVYPNGWCGEYIADKFKIDDLGKAHFKKRLDEAKKYAQTHEESGEKLRASAPESQSTIAREKLK